MKTKLLLMLLFVNGLVIAQIPTTGLVGYYDFTNGSLVDGANGNNFTKTGTASVNVNDRFNVANNAIDLNTDYLTRPDLSVTDLSLSFWIKTSTNDANVRTIIDDSNRTSDAFAHLEYGVYVYLRNGNVGVSGKFSYTNSFNQISNATFGFQSTAFIADGNWHHVVVTVNQNHTISSNANVSSVFRHNTKIYIDNNTPEFNNKSDYGKWMYASMNTTGNFSVANNRSNNLADTKRYLEVFDDLAVYNRVISAAEVSTIAMYNNFCFVPSNTILQTANITETTADISWTATGTFDIAYVLKNDVFSNATIITGLTSGATQVTGLNPSSYYKVYIRELCNSGTTDWSLPIEFRTPGRIYVKSDATGFNDGSSWADAFTNLQDALTLADDNQEIWVAQGTYKPDVSNRDTSFNITKIGMRLYGGFIGTETSLLQRDFRVNTTTLSGDLAANDDAIIEFSNATRNDNSYNIITVNANDAIIDGFTIANAHAFGGSAEQQSGGAIYKANAIVSLEVNNCIFNNNVAYTAAAAIMSRFEVSGTLKVFNTKFYDNLARYGTTIYSYTGNNFTANIEVVNSLFYNNTSKNNGTVLGYSGSAGWYRAYGSGSTMNCNLYNNTYYNNIDTGTASGLNNFNRATVGMSRTSGTFNGDVANCIFWGNTTTGGATTKSIAQVHTNLGQNITVESAIDQNSFSVIPPASVTSSSNSDPLFNDANNEDFTLQASSPAIDNGNGNKLPSNITTDLVGNPRVYNGAVDMGPYEKTCTTACYTLTLNIVGNGRVENNGYIISPSSLFEQNTVLSLIPIAELGEQFAGWSGDGSGNLNPLPITMNADKTITVIFAEAPIYVDKDATGANNGGSWTNAFTTIESAIAVASSDDPIWVADGVYNPSTTNGDSRKATYLIPNDIRIYGGFNGTEALITQRDPKTNITILSGDLNNDDNSTLLHTEPTRQDNAYHVISIRGNTSNIVIDGFTISGGNANGSTSVSCSTPAANQYYDIRGGAIYVNPYVTGHVTSAAFKNCVLENNTGTSVAVFSAFSPCGVTGVSHDIDFESCTVRNNYSQDLSAFLYSGSSGYTIYSKGSIVNSLFHNNTSNSNSGALYLGTSTANGGNTSGIDVDIINTTFSNNIGVNGNTITMIRASNTKIQNSIIYGNGSTTPFNITTSGSVVSNSIVEGGQQSGTNVPPLFTNSSNDFTLQSGSPAINSGDNTKIPSGITTDLAGNTRIYNSTVDMGAYEHDPSLNTILISPKVYLQGAAINPNTGEESLMRDDLRVAGIIPTTSPYADNLMCNVSVFTPTGADAIVDWVFVELRDGTTNTTVMHGQSALLQRDGDVVGIDGVSALTFNSVAGNYSVAIKHRNHLGVMSSSALALSSSSTTVDFTDAANQITDGTNAQTASGMSSGVMGMWSGDSSGDGRLNYSGGLSDAPIVRSQVFNDPNNSFLGGPPVASYPSQGYYKTDVNMDGVTVYSGAESDVLFIRNNIFNNSSNSFLGGPPTSTYIFTQQLPEGAN